METRINTDGPGSHQEKTAGSLAGREMKNAQGSLLEAFANLADRREGDPRNIKLDRLGLSLRRRRRR